MRLHVYHLCQRSRVYSTSLQLTLLTNQDMTHIQLWRYYVYGCVWINVVDIKPNLCLYNKFSSKSNRFITPPPQWTDRSLGKHYLLANTLTGGNKPLPFWCHQRRRYYQWAILFRQPMDCLLQEKRLFLWAFDLMYERTNPLCWWVLLTSDISLRFRYGYRRQVNLLYSP